VATVSERPRRRAASHREDWPVPVTVAPRTVVLVVGVVVGCLALVAFVYAARSILLELVVAIVLAMAAEPLVQVFEGRGLRRGTAVGITFAIASVAALVFAYLLVEPVVRETRHFVAAAPGLVDELTHGRGRLGFLEQRFHVVERTRDALESRPASATAGPVIAQLGSAVRTGGAIVFVAFLTLFVQLGGRQWFRSLVELAPEGSRPRIRRIGEGVADAVGGYVAGNLLISVVAGTVATVALLATGVPYAVPLGLLVAILDLIPLVGATIGTVAAAAVALTQGVPQAVIVVVVLVLYQQVENHSLQQLVYHRTVKLAPLTIALSVAIGADLGGVVGALLAIPFAGALKAVATELVGWRRGDDADPRRARTVGTGAPAVRTEREPSDRSEQCRTTH
jgi:predicted PurR-regulated permease PerM